MVTGASHRILNLFLHGTVQIHRLSKLLQQCGSLDGILGQVNDPELEISASERKILAGEQTNHSDINRYMDWAEHETHSIIDFDSPFYPSLLKQIACPPPLLFVVGKPDVLTSKQVAVVGSRKSSRYGASQAQSFASELTRAGITVTSGLAHGIDGVAHCSALDSGGTTIAVCGSGIDNLYPARHRNLAERIVSSGALVSEFPLGTPPLPHNFPRRNRIISGLSLGTLIIEAEIKSGSLITARLAMEQNREVFALPGMVNSPTSRGCHMLIQQGAKLVQDLRDILEEIGSATSCESQKNNQRRVIDDPQHIKILNSLDPQGSVLEELMLETRLSMGTLMSALLTLEIQGDLEQQGGRYYRSSPPP